MVQVLPPKGKDKWFYVIHERLEPPPQDDLTDPMYSGETILVLAHVPLVCDALDLRTWLLFGIAQDFAPLQQLRTEVTTTRKKKLVVKQKVAALPSMDVDGDAAQQAEVRKKLADAIASHAARFDAQLDGLVKRCKRIERLLMTEPMELTPLAVDSKSTSASSGGNNDAERIETRTWIVKFTSSRGQELASVAMGKCDWTYVCLVQTRPEPKAFVEDDQIENDVVSAADLAKEINMRSVRLRRLKHGEGEYMVPTQTTSSASGVDSSDASSAKPLPPWDDDFHISSIGAMYTGEWRLGAKHGRGVEYTNVGFYDGEFVENARCGAGKFVFGTGTSCVGTFGRPGRTYEYSKRCRGRAYSPSLLNPDAFRESVAQGDAMRVTFPDGAHYEGEMVDGRITGSGKYTSSTGVVDEGTFLDGLLHGESCVRQFPDGSRHEGAFVHGELHGRGRRVERNGDSYDGFFDGGAKQGRATSFFDHRRAKHVGFWHDNMMSGRGDFYYQHVSSSRQDEQQSTPTASRGDDAKRPPAARSNQHEPVPSLLDLDDDSANINDGAVTGASPDALPWDFWYEGAFAHGESVARHRHVDLAHKWPHHLPFTTNGKSSEKMPFLTDVLPQQLRKQHRRAAKNAARRQERERAYLAQRELANLTLYYDMLDTFYDNWAVAKRNAKLDDELAPDERTRVVAERAAMHEFEANRRKFRKERYDLSPRPQDLRRFEECLERITLTEHVQLERAVAAELTDMTAPSVKGTAKLTK